MSITTDPTAADLEALAQQWAESIETMKLAERAYRDAEHARWVARDEAATSMSVYHEAGGTLTEEEMI